MKEHLLEAVKPYGETVMLAYGGGSIKKNGVYEEVIAAKSRTGKSGRSDSGSGRRFGHGLQQGDLNGGCDGQGRLGGILDQKGRD